MKVSVITVFPELYNNFLNTGVIARAIKNGIVTFNLVKLFDHAAPGKRIDHPICGHGVGMLLKPEVVESAIAFCEKKYGKAFKIFFSPQGKKLSQKLLQKFSLSLATNNYTSIKTSHHNNQYNHIILLCARYEGTDIRTEEAFADITISIGDYILMGGDLPAQVFLEAFLRLIPGIIGNQKSIEYDSFSHALFDYPNYTHPVTWNNKKIPDVILSGNHKKISEWRHEYACKQTILKRFDWFKENNPTKNDISVARKYIPSHYIIICHSNVIVQKILEGDTSIASLDIHDIARSSKTYGIKNCFFMSQLKDQQTILKKFLTFWHSKEGLLYNESRYEAVALVQPAYSFKEVLQNIQQKENAKPIIIATSAKKYEQCKDVDFYSQSILWQKNRPILFVFGTGQGLAPSILNQCDYFLPPITGMFDYNHLSVRSAVGIILDRWLGLNPKNLH
jgi:tRNA (guanine37-N1)-methyltransferase